jgi:hypothetical protein
MSKDAEGTFNAFVPQALLNDMYRNPACKSSIAAGNKCNPSSLQRSSNTEHRSGVTLSGFLLPQNRSCGGRFAGTDLENRPTRETQPVPNTVSGA